jgi:hypothetical protein
VVGFFVRYANVPSSSTSIELGTAYSAFTWQSATAGLSLVTGNVTQEGRFNYSRATARSQHGPLDTLSLNSLRASLLKSLFADLSTGLIGYDYASVTQVSIAGLGQTIAGKSGDASELQLQGIYSLAIKAGRHSIQGGGDYTLN